MIGLASHALGARAGRPRAAAGKDARDVANRVFTTAYGAFADFLTRPSAIAILLFVLLFKFCDAFAGVLTAPFVMKIGFDKETYAAIVKGVGFAAALIGGFAGGMIARALPLSTSLWIGGLLQMAVEPRVFLAGAGGRQRRRARPSPSSSRISPARSAP